MKNVLERKVTKINDISWIVDEQRIDQQHLNGRGTKRLSTPRVTVAEEEHGIMGPFLPGGHGADV